MENETLGQVFKRYREAERIGIEKIEEDLKISKRIILALESDDFSVLPDDIYARNIIKAYGQYLNLDYNKLLVLFEHSKNAQVKKSAIYDNKKVKTILTPRMIRIAIIACLVILVTGYLGWQIRQIFEPPKLEIIYPAENVIINDNFIQIKGKTEKEARVFINEKEVYLSPQGEFAIDLDLQNGINMIKISAVKKHSRENVIYREILVQ